jgi:septal ring factor EnvC (AmiA/AmiB activator)
MVARPPFSPLFAENLGYGSRPAPDRFVMSVRHRAVLYRALAALAVACALAVAATRLGTASAASISQLNSQLNQERARQSSLSSSLSDLNSVISSLEGQISLVESREATVRSELAADRAELVRVHDSLVRERARVARLRARLAWARMLLARQLVSSYENAKPDLVTVVLDAHGFNDLLEQINFLRQAEHQQQQIISLTQQAKAQATAAATQLAALQAKDTRVTQETMLHAQALAGMNSLLQAKQAGLEQARQAQELALEASRARGRAIAGQIAHIRAQQLAAERAAAAAAQSAPALGPGGGWAIPYAIVLCESGGQDLPPNYAGASGYYQIMPATWKLFGGAGPAAYLAPKSEQDAIASKIWNGGAGASNWVCAGIVGIH